MGGRNKRGRLELCRRWGVLALGGAALGAALTAGPVRSNPTTAVTIDTSPSARHQVIDGFVTCLSGVSGE